MLPLFVYLALYQWGFGKTVEGIGFGRYK